MRTLTPKTTSRVGGAKFDKRWSQIHVYIRIARYGMVEIFCERKVIIVIGIAGCSSSRQAKQSSLHLILTN